MHIRCPHCWNAVEVVEESVEDIACPSCDSRFSVVNEGPKASKPPSRQLGHYELSEVVGVGGFGAVWSARDTRLDRVVAIKLPRGGNLATQTEKDAFLREARAAAQLRHPNIVAIHEVGNDDDQVYIVSDLIHGETLESRLESGPLTARDCAELVAKVAEAIHFAHEAGVIHRDLKPSNIMLDVSLNPHVMDFGVAKREAGEITMTIDGEILGTPAYMSPEQAQGRARDADPRSDVYSLGVVLYECLTGEKPFRGNTIMMIQQVIESEPTPVRRLSHTTPKDLENVCLKCMEKDPALRYQTAEQLAADLGRFLDGEAVQAKPVSLARRMVSRIRRRPDIAAIVAVVLIAVLVIGVFSYWERRRSQRLATQTSVENLLKLRGETIPYAIRELRQFPKAMVVDELREKFDDNQGSRQLATAFALAAFGEEEPEVLIRGVKIATDEDRENFVTALKGVSLATLEPIFAKEIEQADKQEDWETKSRLALVSTQLGDTSWLRDLHSRSSDDATQSTVFVHDVFDAWRGDAEKLKVELEQLDDPATQAAVALALGNLDASGEDDNSSKAWRPVLEKWYASPDAGLRNAAGWALRKWFGDEGLPTLNVDEQPKERNWRTTPLGLTMIRVDPGEFTRYDAKENPQRVRLTKPYWLSDREITYGQYELFLKDRPNQAIKPPQRVSRRAATDEHPVELISWETAVLYCNWLSEREGFEPCYQVASIEPIHFHKNVKPLPTNVAKTLNVELIDNANGYRLATDAEWEWACRAGTTTRYSFGSNLERMPFYGVSNEGQSDACGSRMCNRWGFHDMHGNMIEWVFDSGGLFRLREVQDPIRDEPDNPLHIPDREGRGGSYNFMPRFCSSHVRRGAKPAQPGLYGIRVAQGDPKRSEDKPDG